MRTLGNAACKPVPERPIPMRYALFNLLTSDELLDSVEAALPEHRERLLPPTETLSA